MGDRIVAARIIDDRGVLGAERIVRVSIGDTASATSSFDVLYSTLLPAPRSGQRASESADEAN